jgi:hypothetical protein
MTTTAHTPADDIQNVWVAADTTWPVDYSLETAHERVAVLKLPGMSGWHLAVQAGRGWEHVRGATTVTEALSLVPAVVAKHFA